MTRAPLGHEYDGAPELPPKTELGFRGWAANLIVYGWFTVAAIAVALIVWGGK